MNYIDIFAVLIIFVGILVGYNQGFLKSMFNIVNIIISILIGLVFYGAVAKDITANPQIMPTVIHFSEASEMLGGIEVEKISVYERTLDDIKIIVNDADLPYPVAELLLKNIEDQAFAGLGYYTLGDYLEQTIGCMTINYVSFAIVFLIVFLIFMVLISISDYVFSFPVLHSMDSVAGGIGGFVQALLLLNIVFLVIPMILTFLPFDELVDMTQGSWFSKIYYFHNILIKMIRGAI